MGTEKPHNASTGQCEIADGIKNLVPDEFVSIAQAFGIENSIALQGNGIFKRRAERETGLPKPLDIGKKTEGARAGQLTAENGGRQIDPLALLADRSAGKIDIDVEAQTRLHAHFPSAAAHKRPARFRPAPV